MARNISDIYNLINFIVRKQKGTYISPEDAMAALDAGQLIKFNEDFSLYSQSQSLSDSIRPFKVTNLQFTSTSGGIVTYQADHLHLLEGVYTVNGSTVNKVEMMTSAKLPYALTNQLRKVVETSPVGTETAAGFILYPQMTHIGFYSYMKRPDTPVYSYTIDPVTRVVTYNPAGSTQLEWGDNYIDSVIAKALQYIGINMDEQQVVEFSQLINQQTTT